MAPSRHNPTLLDDLISEILVRVPVKSLLCFHSVSKTWLSLIKHPAFVKSQLRHAITTQNNQTLFMYHTKDRAHRYFSLLRVDSGQIVANFKFPYRRRVYKSAAEPTIVGSANGIVCVAVAVDFPYHAPIIYIWNPAIRQYKDIPSPIDGEEVLGFGYDQIDHDFKVVKVDRFGSPPIISAEVYSDNRNTWRKVPDPMDIPCSGHFDVCVNGFLCGIGEHGMMAFDLYKDVLNCAINLPVIAHGNEAQIIEFNNSVAVIILIKGLSDVNADQRLDGKINIWTLNYDACLRGGGVEASWTPMFSIDTDSGMEARIIHHGLFSNGDFLLLMINENDDYVWISCDVDKKEAKLVPLSIDMAKDIYTHNVYKYTESLVSLPGFKQIKGEDDN